MDDRLSELRQAVIEALEASRTASQVYDGDGRLRWVSPQLLELAGADDSAEVGYGRHIDEGLELPLWAGMLSEEARRGVREELEQRLASDSDPAPVWVSPVELHLAKRRRPVGMLGVTVRAADGSLAGTALVFAPLLPARVLALVSEGDEAMFARMADLTEPRRRPTAVVFADIDSSGRLSRLLPTPAYFELVRRFTTTFDDLVARHGGIVGKHAGDGASAFFLSAQAGQDSGPAESDAAAAAVAVALAFPPAVRAIVEELAAEGVGVRLEDCRVNLGVHWGANLYIGQIVTGGRLEVTALGDEVNECARIEHVASGGQTLVSKTVLERLDADAARGLGIDPMALTYQVLADLTGSDTKALRDAGSLAVVDLAALGAGPDSA
ncbi:adenylate/guanylate cyclase domain-containing protein [Actinomycetospora sp. TBRC 11914]|uniref:adenylate/guanylate cyclase domain-containing protein n=1 Tax=Actinomycetospora sp. TBRC 11914 TaxID=2729387 RepID=UPI00145D4F45|nr:adenylate/guanylate cyclase domain-containing protein [Actinomycetospora sp. TBRC 11914]NMO90551.1 adenylate/guanylate cyclase domain-containing protein [Actinomycetospora sp. TBRC 11914]